MRNYFLTSRAFVLFFGIVVVFALAFRYEFLFVTAQITLYSLIFLVLIDVLLLSIPPKSFEYERILPDKLSNGDKNEIQIRIKSLHRFKVWVSLLEDLPAQIKTFDYAHKITLKPFERKQIIFEIQPKDRGVYLFGNAYILSKTRFALVQKRHLVELQQQIPCYPSFLQLRKYEFLAINNKLTIYGTKKVRSVEQNTAFAQIKEYTQGDDYKHINWKASARNNGFFVNQYQAERSQNIYCILDKSRAMKMPFNGQTLLDYAVNAALVLSNIAIKKGDRAGLLSFARIPDGFLKASSKALTMQVIAKELYKIETNFLESDFGRLYKFLNHQIKNRSLLLLFTNFETYNAYERQEKYLRAIAKKHLLVVIFFENSEVKSKVENTPDSLADYYEHTIAEQLIKDKKNIAKELRKYGIQSIITKPEHLTVDAINSYLSIRKRGVL